MANDLAAALHIARKDLAIEWRTRSAFFAAIVFAMLAAATLYFAWDPAEVAADTRAPGVFWVIFVFSGVLGLQRSFSVELADRAIDGLLSSPVSRTAIFLGKMLANSIFIIGIQLVTLPAVIVFYNQSAGLWLAPFCGILLLATVGLASLGTLFSSMAVNTRLAELMLPMLSLPFFLPVVAMAARATDLLIDGAGGDVVMAPVKVLLAFDLVFVSASAAVFPFTFED